MKKAKKPAGGDTTTASVLTSQPAKDLIVPADAENTAGALLPTATVWILGPNGRRRKTLCFLDIGSQRSFIRQSIAKDLGLDVVRAENLSILSFGHENDPESDKYDIRRLTVKGTFPNAPSIYIAAVEKANMCTLPAYTDTAFAKELRKSGHLLPMTGLNMAS